jgi:hypothetical protein
MYQQASSEVIPKAKELSKIWHDDLTQDYWLLYYLLRELCPDKLANLGQETIRIAYEKMLKNDSHIRGNELRPIMNCHAKEKIL